MVKSLSLENRLPPEIVKEIFEYSDGVLLWKIRPVEHFKTKRAQSLFNARYAGKQSGTPLSPAKEYLISQISYLGEKHSLLLHIATWVVVHGEYPSGDIDHIDGNGMNNAISNLRDCGKVLNMQNKAKYRNNKSGVCGVCWYPRYNKWVAQGSSNNTKVTIGYFASLFDAVCARKSWELGHSFSERHGK